MTSLPIHKNNSKEVVHFDVYLSPKGKKIATNFLKEFPEIPNYFKRSVPKWKGRVPSNHKVHPNLLGS